MKPLFFALLILTLFSSCNEGKKNELIKGDIYIKLIDVLTLSNQFSEEEIKNQIVDSTINLYSDSEKKLMEYFKTLIKHNLYKKPYFKLKIESGEVINVYANESEFLKLKKELNDFDKDKEKISVKFKGTKISDGIIDPNNIFNQAIFYAKNIISVQKTKGVTDWAK